MTTCATTTHHGTVPYVRYCSSPIPICTRRIASSTAQPRSEPGPLPPLRPRPGREYEEHDPECGHGTDVQPDGVVKISDSLDDLRPVASGEPASSGRERPGDDEHADGEEEGRTTGACDRRKRRRALVRGEQCEDREPEHRQRHQQVRDDEIRIEVVVDGDRSERRLRERANEDGGCEQAGVARKTARPPRGECEPECRQHRDSRDDAVRELDVGVVALRQRVGRVARRPMRAAEAGAGEPNGRTGADDDDEAADRGPRDAAEPHRTELQSC